MECFLVLRLAGCPKPTRMTSAFSLRFVNCAHSILLHAVSSTCLRGTGLFSHVDNAELEFDLWSSILFVNPCLHMPIRDPKKETYVCLKGHSFIHEASRKQKPL